jgi:hypothetical protein
VALLQRRNILALSGAILAVLLMPTAALAAGTSDVSVRVEGLSRTLLAPTAVNTKSGWITKGGTPKGSCSATTAAGALDLATRHRWTGKWESNYSSLLLTSILGESHTLSSKAYWSIWVDGKYAQSGLCGLKLRRGEQLLFAAVPDSFNGHPLLLSAPAGATAGKSFTVKVSYVAGSGKRKPLGHVHITGGGVSAFTDGQGTATIVDDHAGTLKLAAAKTGYIRAAVARVRVSG